MDQDRTYLAVIGGSVREICDVTINYHSRDHEQAFFGISIMDFVCNTYTQTNDTRIDADGEPDWGECFKGPDVEACAKSLEVEVCDTPMFVNDWNRV